MGNVEIRVDAWKKKLLDLGKRNRLLNFRETKRSNLNILTPSLPDLYATLVAEETEQYFSYPVEADMIGDYNLFDAATEERPACEIRIIEGDFTTNQSILDQQKTLKALRNKGKTAIEEQGVNVLYLAFGFLTWKESVSAKDSFRSPIILVPVTLTHASLTAPYKLTLHDDEIVLNPTLKYKMENDFNIVFPDFDADTDDIAVYLSEIQSILSGHNWVVDDKVSLSIFSFLKINMYMDLDKRTESVSSNFAVKALCGDLSELPEVSQDLSDYSHDLQNRPIDVFQTVDADSSQQDAIELSKRGNSFVLQGPPGTGKSQTITNIISEALADGKKVLFVSEKMAALEVVYRRLEKVGLADFCLTLHNHKANKKEILKNLGDTLSLDRIRMKDDALYELEVLQQERQALNNYAQELHTVVMPMEKSIYQVNGLLAKRTEMPNLIFDFSDITSVSASRMREFEYLLDRFAKTTGLLSEDYSDNVWKGSHVPQVTHELRQQIEVKANGISGAFQRFLQDTAACLDTLGLDRSMTYQQTTLLSECLPLCSDAPRIPKEWLTRDDIKSMVDMVRTYSARQQEFVSTIEWIDGYYAPEIYTVNALDKRAALSSLHVNVKLNPALYPDNESVYDEMVSTIETCTQGLTLLHDLRVEISSVTAPYKIEICQTLEGIHAYLPILEELNKPIHGTNLWFDKENLSRAVALCQELSVMQTSLADNRQTLLSTYEKGILDIDFEGILNRFKTEYTNIFKVFKSTYKSDLNQLRINAIIPMKKVPDDEMIRVLTAVKNIKEEEFAFQSKAQGAVDLLGDLFTGEATDFTAIFDQLNSCRIIMEHTGFHASNALRRLILSGENTGMFTDSIAKITELVSSTVLCNVFEIAQLSATGSIQESITVLTTLKGQMTELQCEYGEITRSATGEVSFDHMEETIEKLCLVQEIKEELTRNEFTLKDTFLFMFDGTETNWEEIKDALTWLGTFMPYIEKLGLKEQFIDHVISLQYKQDIQALIGWIEGLQQEAENDFTWFNALYETEYQLWDLPLSNAINKLNRCTQNLHGLEQWNDFKNALENCRNNGLGQVVDVVLDEKVRPQLVVDSFKKRFYKLWLDAIMPSYPAVYQFRRKSHEDMISRFRSFDVKQMSIAKARVKAGLIDRLPDVNKITSSKDEVGILKRELAKQRKIMPIRRLFANIPTLLPALKPCLMMSPLSVSLFLDSDLYQFDMVIFDEASQVCTENAIGAMMRGKQIIVAGDNKQLPPTSFFSAATSDGDYDVEDDDDGEDLDNYESILDEMLTAFPERSLKWHYRSKNEELITFSNVKIYNQSLITFPSAAEHTADNGVEYIYVSNGIYDRGGKKNNINEAKHVAHMVFEHFKKGDHRSLGVIAFSGAQQQAIDDEITKMRLANPLFEPFFDESQDEPFFVKNLENVQGDERDTIIFSIGYAKDTKGVMYMNFGPLSRDGGYRRLNVAITRAKYNVKLVGSIQPTDIKSDVNAEGVKMLRSYIEFAMRGKVALENELRYDRFVDVDSPFEEAVYDFLVSKGYRVTTQVGCSGYRIDMAVKHPTLDGRFVIAIECDGATYHSSRTARERDRLRQAVLEDMGWRFHRIWSTDWIKDPITEGELLVEAVEKAIVTYVDGFEESPPVEVHEEQEDYFEADESVTEAESAGAIKFDIYVEADARAARLGDLGLIGIKRAILKTVELEYPVHYEVLCRRIAPIFGNQKATVKVRNNVDYALQRMGEDVMRKGDFFYPPDSPAVKPKAPPSGESPRAVNHISDDEIGVAMTLITTDSYGLPKQNLFQITAKELGFNRTGANITRAFERVFEALVKNGELEYVEGKVRVSAR